MQLVQLNWQKRKTSKTSLLFVLWFNQYIVQFVQTRRQVDFSEAAPRGVPRNRWSENMQHFYRRTPMSKCDFNNKLQSNFIEITLPCGCSPVNLLHIFRAPFRKNSSVCLLLTFYISIYRAWIPFRMKIFLQFWIHMNLVYITTEIYEKIIVNRR